MSTGEPVLLQVKLTRAEHTALTQWSRGINASQALTRRSLIILECAKGLSDADAARALNVHPKTVRRWRRRFHEKRIDGLTENRRGTPVHQASDSEPTTFASKRGEGGFGKKELRATILESRATAVGAVVAAIALLVGFWQYSNQQKAEQIKESRRYVDKIAWWDGYDHGGFTVHFANRSTAKLSSLLIRNQAPGDVGYVIDMGTIAPCTVVTIKISRSVFPTRLPDGRKVLPLWQTGGLEFWDPVGYWVASGGIMHLQIRRSETDIEPTDRFGGLEESSFINVSEISYAEPDAKKIFTNIPKVAEPANDCS